METAKFVFCMAVAPRGVWRVHGIEFSREWRALRLGETLNIEGAVPTLDAATKEQIDRDVKIGALAMRPGTAAEVDAYIERLLKGQSEDPAVVIADLKAKNADLESRLLKLELASTGGARGGRGGEQPQKSDAKA